MKKFLDILFWPLVAFSFLGWFLILLPRSISNLPGTSIVTCVYIIVILALGFLAVGLSDFKPFKAIATVSLIAMVLLQGFTLAYYAIGALNDFSMPLTRLDALYVALGNFTTAGSGNIYPTSEYARSWVIGQYSADFIYLTALVSFLLWRVSKNGHAQ